MGKDHLVVVTGREVEGGNSEPLLSERERKEGIRAVFCYFIVFKRVLARKNVRILREC